MPYRPSHLMKTLARGLPLPSGSPERALAEAIAHVSPLDIERAVHQGARPTPIALHQVFDRCLDSTGHLTVPMPRLIGCCRALDPRPADWKETDPRTGWTALRRAAALAAHPQALLWYQFLSRRGPRHWDLPEGPDRLSPLDLWHAKADEATRAHLPPLPPRSSGLEIRPLRPR